MLPSAERTFFNQPTRPQRRLLQSKICRAEFVSTRHVPSGTSAGLADVGPVMDNATIVRLPHRWLGAPGETPGMTRWMRQDRSIEPRPDHRDDNGSHRAGRQPSDNL